MNKVQQHWKHMAQHILEDMGTKDGTLKVVRSSLPAKDFLPCWVCNAIMHSGSFFFCTKRTLGWELHMNGH